MNLGWVKLHRQLLEWEWYDDINTCRLFIHCILRANHADKTWRGNDIKRGSFLTSLESLNKETGLTVSQIRTSIKKLISTNEIASKTQAKSRIITVVGYDSYQDDSKQVSSQVTSKSQASSNKQECKNEKNDNKINNSFCYEVVELYNLALNDLPKVKVVSDTRISHIKACVKQFKNTEHDFESLETWEKLFNYVSRSDFLMGRSKESFLANFDWITKKANLIKIVEGNYE